MFPTLLVFKRSWKSRFLLKQKSLHLPIFKCLQPHLDVFVLASRGHTAFQWRHGVGICSLWAGMKCALSGSRRAKPEPRPVQWEQLDWPSLQQDLQAVKFCKLWSIWSLKSNKCFKVYQNLWDLLNIFANSLLPSCEAWNYTWRGTSVVTITDVTITKWQDRKQH